MQYLSDNYERLLINENDTDPNMQITTITKDKAMNILSNIEGFQCLIDNENSVDIISQTLGISIKDKNTSKVITPYDILIVVQPKKLGTIENFDNDLLNFMEIELNATWRVDYYSENEELLKQIELGVLSYSQAKREAFLIGERIPYFVYDIYYIKQ